MAFDLYFAGASNLKLDDYIVKHNCNRLCSQLNERNTISKFIDIKNNTKNCKSKLFIDSGAWSAHSKGKIINVDDYIRFLNNNDSNFHIYAQLDKIPGEFRKPKTSEQKLEAAKISWDNYLYMKDKVKTRDKLLPIFHQGEDYKWLENMLEYTHEDTGRHIPYIGISPANDVSVNQKITFIDKCFEIIKNSSNPNVHTHAFGMTSLNVLEQYPFTSADSTSWIMTGANGGIMTDVGIITISENQKYDKNHILNLSTENRKYIESIINKYGFNIDELSKDYVMREMFNIAYLKNWADNYTYKPLKIKQHKLF